MSSTSSVLARLNARPASRPTSDSAYTQFDNKPATLLDKDKNLTKEEKLWAAIKNNNLNQVLNLLHAGARSTVTDPYGFTALHYAADFGGDEICQELLEQGAKPNVADKNGQTPLMYAAVNGHFKICQLLLDAKASPNMLTEDGQSALHKACYGNGQHQFHIVKLIHSKKGRINQQRLDGRTPLMISAERGSIDVVKYLLEAKADTNLVDSTGKTVLHMTATTGSSTVLKLLVQQGSDPSIRDEEGVTADGVTFQRSLTVTVGEEELREEVRTAIDHGLAAREVPEEE